MLLGQATSRGINRERPLMGVTGSSGPRPATGPARGVSGSLQAGDGRGPGLRTLLRRRIAKGGCRGATCVSLINKMW